MATRTEKNKKVLNILSKPINYGKNVVAAAKAMPGYIVNRVKTAKNINRMANRDATQYINNIGTPTKDDNVNDWGFNNIMNKADRIYKKSKNDLNKQVPRNMR